MALEVNTKESVANWCAVDTRTGRLACVLEENNCFDAEMYADEVAMDNPMDFREDQRSELSSSNSQIYSPVLARDEWSC